MINLDVKNIKITENYNKISIFLYVAVIHATNSQNLTSNIWNLKLGFFHEKKFARTLCHFVHFITKQYYINPSVCWRKLEYMKFTLEDEKIRIFFSR